MSSNPADRKKKLSKHVLEMKFMQRGSIRDEQEKLNSDTQRAIDDEHWVLDLPDKDNLSCQQYIVEPSYAICENLIFGRRSFRGFNAEIEKICKVMDSNQALQASEEREQDMSVNDEDMAERYSSLVGTIGKKFAKKRQKSEMRVTNGGDFTNVGQPDDSVPPSAKKQKSHKKKFLKPVD